MSNRRARLQQDNQYSQNAAFCWLFGRIFEMRKNIALGVCKGSHTKDTGFPVQETLAPEKVLNELGLPCGWGG